MSKISILSFFILTSVIGYAFIYPTAGEIKTLLNEQQKYEDSLEMVSNIEAKKSELLTKFNSISSEDKASIDTVLPDSFNFVRLISQIDSVASRYGIAINDISSKEISSSVGSTIENAESPREYQSAAVEFSFSSSYDQYNSFLGDLEKSLRILDLKSTKITSNEEKKVFNYTVELETYWLKTL